jgi:hypothetical protein
MSDTRTRNAPRGARAAVASVTVAVAVAVLLAPGVFDGIRSGPPVPGELREIRPAAVPATPPESCGELRPLGEPARKRVTHHRDGVRLWVGTKSVKPTTVRSGGGPGTAGDGDEWALAVTLELVAGQDTSVESNLQALISILDEQGRVVADWPYRTARALFSSSLELTAREPRTLTERLSSCDPTDPGVPKGARYLLVAADAGPLAGTYDLP